MTEVLSWVIQAMAGSPVNVSGYMAEEGTSPVLVKKIFLCVPAFRNVALLSVAVERHFAPISFLRDLASIAPSHFEHAERPRPHGGDLTASIKERKYNYLCEGRSYPHTKKCHISSMQSTKYL